MKRSLLLFASSAGLLFLAGGWATAGPVNWTYSFSPSQAILPADNNSGSVAFSQSSGTAQNSSNVIVSNLSLSSTALPSSPNTFVNSGAYQVGLTITDQNNGQTSPTIFLTGKLGITDLTDPTKSQNTFSQSNANVGNTFSGIGTDPSNPQSSYTWTASNGDKFTLSSGLLSYTAPGPPIPPSPGSPSPVGSIGAYINVTGGTGTVSSTPEPSTLVLSCLGLAFAGVTSWRERRHTFAELLA